MRSGKEATSTTDNPASPRLSGAEPARPPDVAPDDETDRDGRQRLLGLAEKGKRLQWNVAADLDWTLDDSASPRPEASRRAQDAFGNSSLKAYGPDVWTRFRSEFQSWMISQFLPGEYTAMLASTRLAEQAPHNEARLCLAEQAADEVRHVAVFSRYIRERITHPYPTSHALGELLQRATAEPSWDISVLGMHVVVEALALAAFRLADRTFDGPLIRAICARVAADEARHVAVGVLCLRDIYPTLTAAERRYREDFVMVAAHLVREQFLFDEIWDRMGIPRQDGRAFAATDPTLLEYRQIICSRLISALATIGLLTIRVQAYLRQLQLLPERQLARYSRPGFRRLGSP